MKRNSIFAGIFLLMASVVFPMAANAQSANVQGDPVKLLQYIADNMLAQLKTKKATLKDNPAVVYNIAYKYVVPYADINFMSRRVLSPKVWNSASATQRMQFQKEFTTLLIRTYASALNSYKDQSIRFYPIRGGYEGKRSVKVGSDIISSSGQPIHVSYRLVRSGSVWRLYDMSVEGISMLQSFRSQFADILSRGDMDQLLQRIGKHNAR